MRRPKNPISNRTIAYRGHSVDVVLLDLAFDVPQQWEVVTIRDGVGIVAVDRQGRLVLLREFAAGPELAVTTIPKGFIENGESAADAARRELAEETGFTKGEFMHVGEIWPNPSYEQSKMQIFLATNVEPGAPTPRDEQHSLEVRLVEASSYRAEVVEEQYISAITIAAITLADPFPAYVIPSNELIDRFLVLEEKISRLGQDASPEILSELANARQSDAGRLIDSAPLKPHIEELRRIHSTLWDLENEVRRDHISDAQCLAAYRGISALNQKRARLKRLIGEALGDGFVDDKHYG